MLLLMIAVLLFSLPQLLLLLLLPLLPRVTNHPNFHRMVAKMHLKARIPKLG
jgi:hypothetical protein